MQHADGAANINSVHSPTRSPNYKSSGPKTSDLPPFALHKIYGKGSILTVDDRTVVWRGRAEASGAEAR